MQISAILTSIPAQKYSHIVASTMSKHWVAAGVGTSEVIGINGFRVASMTKRSLKKTSEGLCTQLRQVFARITVEP